jgi:hypothetical protein
VSGNQHCQRAVRRTDAAPRQSLAEHRPRAYEPPCHGPFRDLELAGRFLPRLPFQITQNEDRPIPTRQASEFLIEYRERVAPGTILSRDRFGDRLDLPFAATGTSRSGLECGADRDAVKPVPDPVGRAHRLRFADQNQKGCLKSVFGVLPI